MGHPDDQIEKFMASLPGSFRTVTLSATPGMPSDPGKHGFAGFAFNTGYIRHRHTEIRRKGETFIETLIRARNNYAQQQPTVFKATEASNNVLPMQETPSV